MRAKSMHPWNLTPTEAVQLQKDFKNKIRTDIPFKRPRRIAGVDVAYLPREKQSIASVVVLSCDGLERLESTVARSDTPVLKWMAWQMVIILEKPLSVGVDQPL
jgi:hypothetical protein